MKIGRRMRESAITVLALILTGYAEKWQLQNRTSEWTFESVHADVSDIVNSSGISTSLIGCAAFCSNGYGEPSLMFIPGTGRCICNPATGSATEDENQPEVVYGSRRKLKQVDISDNERTWTTFWPPHDCSDLSKDSNNDDGVYVVYPSGGSETETWCDMTNGGWTLILRRMDGSENFYRGWNDFVNGFGDKAREYWIGLETIHSLTSHGSELIVYIQASTGMTPESMTANYSHFQVGDSASKYVLDIGGFSGTCGDSLEYENGQPFSTFDNDNDGSPDNCAISYRAGWWYKQCHRAHLTGPYYQEGEYVYNSARGIHWATCWVHRQSAQFASMKVRRLS